MNAFLVDDEPLARERLKALIAHADGFLKVSGESGTATEAISTINEQKPDVVFLDIQMPELDGFDVVSLLEEPRPYIIFVTAYDQYAIKAFDVYALDYLTKPVRLERLNKTIDRLKDIRDLKTQQQTAFQKALEEQKTKPLHVLTAKKGRSIRILDIQDVLFIEAEDKLLFATTGEGRFRVDGTLDELESRLEHGRYIRTHRSFLVNARSVKELIPWFSGTYELKLSNGNTIPVSRRRVKSVKELLGA